MSHLVASVAERPQVVMYKTLMLRPITLGELGLIGWAVSSVGGYVYGLEPSLRRAKMRADQVLK